MNDYVWCDENHTTEPEPRTTRSEKRRNLRKLLSFHHILNKQEAQLNARAGRPYFPINLILTLRPSLIDF